MENEYFNDENSNNRLWENENAIRETIAKLNTDNIISADLIDDLYKKLGKIVEWRIEYFQNIMDE